MSKKPVAPVAKPVAKPAAPAAKPAAKAAAPKKKAGERSTYIAKAPIRRLMKNEGAGLVSEAAVGVLIAKLTKVGTELTKAAVKYAKDDKRKRITGSDVIAAERKL
jgi:histone H3/H4